MPPRSNAAGQKAAAEAAQKARLKPGAVSEGRLWEDDDPKTGFQTAGKKKRQEDRPRPAPAPAAAPAVVAPPPKKPLPPLPPGYVPGAEAVAPAPKPKPKPQPKQQRSATAAAAPAPPESEEFATVSKKKPQAQGKPRAPQVSREGRRVDPHDGRAYTWAEFEQCYGDEAADYWAEAITEQAALQQARQAQQKAKPAPPGYVPGAVTEDPEAAKKRAKDERKARELAAKAAAREAEASKKDQEKPKKAHKDPVTVQVVQGPRQQQGGGAAASSSAWGHKGKVAIPKPAKTERAVAPIDAAALARFRAQHASDEHHRLEPAEIVFHVKIQAKWYPARELLARQDFAHAPEVVKSFCQGNDSGVGGFFISQCGQNWANEHTVDQFWMAQSYVTAMTKLLAAGPGASELLQPYWGQGDVATVRVRLAAPEGQPLTLTLTHETKHGSQLQELRTGVHDFVRKLIAEAHVMLVFVTKLDAACATVATHPKWQSEERQRRVGEVRERLPKRLEPHLAELEDAFAAFQRRHPDPEDGSPAAEGS